MDKFRVWSIIGCTLWGSVIGGPFEGVYWGYIMSGVAIVAALFRKTSHPHQKRTTRRPAWVPSHTLMFECPPPQTTRYSRSRRISACNCFCSSSDCYKHDHFYAVATVTASCNNPNRVLKSRLYSQRQKGYDGGRITLQTLPELQLRDTNRGSLSCRQEQ